MSLDHNHLNKLVLHSFRQRLNGVRQQAIAWANVDLDIFRSMASLGHNMLNDLILQTLTHWGRMTHICVSELTIIGSDNGLSPERRQAIIWTSAGILLIEPLGTNFNEISIAVQTFFFHLRKMYLKMSSAKRRPLCLGLDVLKLYVLIWIHSIKFSQNQLWETQRHHYMTACFPHLSWSWYWNRIV